MSVDKRTLTKKSERNAQIVELAKSGLVAEQIAKRFGITRARVYQLLHKYAPETIGGKGRIANRFTDGRFKK